MPFVRICVTGDEERPTPEQKRELYFRSDKTRR